MQHPDYAVRSNQPSSFTLSQKLKRALWELSWLLLFRPSPRVLHVYFGALCEGLEPEPVSSFYLDVF